MKIYLLFTNKDVSLTIPKQEIKMILHERHIAIFRKINPAKKYSEFSYYDIKSFNDIWAGDIGTDMIFKINSSYYQFHKEQTFNTPDENYKSKIIVKDGRKEIFSKPY